MSALMKLLFVGYVLVIVMTRNAVTKKIIPILITMPMMDKKALNSYGSYSCPDSRDGNV
jgi:hypothetical protein